MEKPISSIYQSIDDKMAFEEQQRQHVNQDVSIKTSTPTRTNTSNSTQSSHNNNTDQSINIDPSFQTARTFLTTTTTTSPPPHQPTTISTTTTSFYELASINPSSNISQYITASVATNRYSNSNLHLLGGKGSKSADGFVTNPRSAAASTRRTPP